MATSCVAEPRPVRAQPADETAVLNALTVDVEDYYHVTAFEDCAPRRLWDCYESRVVASTEKVLRLLEEAGVRGTFFVLGWVADRFPGLVRAVQRAGHEVGCHSYWHRRVHTLTPDEFRADLCQARDVLQDILGERVTAFRAPTFSILRDNLWALDVLIEEGFTLDSSIYPTHHDRYGIPGFRQEPHEIQRAKGSITEFPAAIYRCCGYPLPVGGGGYFRLYPYALTRHGLRAVNAVGRPFMTYFHPWEFDPDQPHMPARRLTRFRHCVNLHRTDTRLRRLLSDFRFGTMSEALTACRFAPRAPARAA